MAVDKLQEGIDNFAGAAGQGQGQGNLQGSLQGGLVPVWPAHSCMVCTLHRCATLAPCAA